MSIIDTIEICKQNYLFLIGLNQYEALLNLIMIEDDSEKTRKFSKSITFE